MDEIYKIETQGSDSAKAVANCIESASGKAVVLGSAVVTDHRFSQREINSVMGLIAKTTSEITVHDLKIWESKNVKS